ncbi:MAG: asparagine synthase (glutamine-hydrolyzing) [Acidobacteriota bacterium]|nr:asparagine synthase (glutamine-hydrolyzing) [Acidobacteriota bacterium]
MTASLFHRGPDQQGVFVSPDVCLGAVRLKIIDLAGGDQPITCENGDTTLVFNGEIYNHRELRNELEGLGRRFRSQCDTEVLLQAFLQWDTRCFERLRGMFAAAIWSQSQKRLILARDRVGIKPLYTYRRGRDIYFGSELKAILENPQIPRYLNLEALQDYLSLNFVPGPRTLIEGIEKLPPGHLLEYRDGETQTRPYWCLDFAPRKDLKLETAKEELDFLLRESVREHLASDVPLGIWSSGGLDSSTVLHYAASECPAKIKTFSVSFPGRACDESRYFREIARRYGTEHHEFEMRPDASLLTAIEDLAFYSDEPGADAGALPVWFLSRMSRQHVTVALSGDGGDELFGGYQTYRADDLARPLRYLPAAMRRSALAGLVRCWPVSDKKISFEYKLKRWIEGSLLSPDEAHLFWNGTFSQSQKQNLQFGANGHHLNNLFDCLPRSEEIGFLNRYMLLDQQYYLPDNILYKVDRMSMAHSLEVRPPFLDHRIVEFAASLPENLKIRGGKQKFLLKELMEGKLPSSVVRRRKEGFDIPTHDWFRGFLRPLLMDTLSAEAVESTGIFDFDATERLIRDHMDRRVNAGYHLWGLLTLFLWLKRWNVHVAPPADSLRESPSRVLVAS